MDNELDGEYTAEDDQQTNYAVNYDHGQEYDDGWPYTGDVDGQDDQVKLGNDNEPYDDPNEGEDSEGGHEDDCEDRENHEDDEDGHEDGSKDGREGDAEGGEEDAGEEAAGLDDSEEGSEGSEVEGIWEPGFTRRKAPSTKVSFLQRCLAITSHIPPPDCQISIATPKAPSRALATHKCKPTSE